MEKDRGISYIVPAFNEENAIVQTLEQLIQTLKQIGLPYEVIVVNDGSTDQTPTLVSGFPQVKLINHPMNIGYGNALKSGIRHVRYEWIAIIDADGTYPIEDLPKLIAEMENGFDMVIGVRTNMNTLDPVLKRMCRWIYRSILRSFVTVDIQDANSGFRVFKRDLVVSFLPYLCGSFSFTTSLTVLAVGNDYFVKQVPVTSKPRVGKSKIHHLRDSIRTFQFIIQGMTFYNPIKFFMVLAFAMIFFVCIPAMIFACFRMHTLSLYYIIFGATVILLFALGTLGDIIRVSMLRVTEHNPPHPHKELK